VIRKAIDRSAEIAALLGQLQIRAALRKIDMWIGRRERRFTIIYEDNLWLSKESRSGPGSEVENTRRIRAALPGLIEELNVKTLLDAPCGDFNWMRFLDTSSIHYVGIDIVREIVDKNHEKYSNRRREFIHCDMLADPLPKADLVLCRDCLIHLSYHDTRTAIESFKKTGARYILTNTYDSVDVNQDIRTGNWRPINLAIDPYHFPAPVSSVCESPEEEKLLALYNLQELNTTWR